MFDEAKKAIRSSSLDSSVYVGADSIRFKKRGQWWAKYSTVIVLHNDSKYGCTLFHKSVSEPDYGSMKQRLLTEVMHATAAASEIIEDVGNRHLEIHIDVNPSPKHKSSVVAKEAMGYVKGSLGLDAIIKPHSWAATHAADRLVRKGDGGGAV